MRLAIMQPYFFPYLGHFALIAHCDRWVVFDTTQYTPKSWMSRNRILHPNDGWTYISVPLANGSIHITTKQAILGSFAQFAASLRGKLSHYRHRAPFAPEVGSLVDDILRVPTDSLVDLNVRALETICSYIGIPFNYEHASDYDCESLGVDHPGGWAPAISALLGAREYINPIGGRQLFRPGDFDSRGIALKFLEFSDFVYGTDPYRYQPGLSIIDVMMWNAPQAIRSAVASNTRIIDADSTPQMHALAQ